jgi:hypothetical protein
VIKSLPMSERQRAHIDYFLEHVEYWRGIKRDASLARMLAARDANNTHPLRSEEEGAEVFEYLRRPERGRTYVRGVIRRVEAPDWSVRPDFLLPR